MSTNFCITSRCDRADVPLLTGSDHAVTGASLILGRLTAIVAAAVMIVVIIFYIIIRSNKKEADFTVVDAKLFI